MKQRPRRYITDSEMALIWDRWEKGETLNAMAGDLGRYHSAVQGALARKLMSRWSPWQIAGWLKRSYPDDMSLQVSHETIYKTLFIQARGALKKELIKHLRRSRAQDRTKFFAGFLAS